MENFQLVSSCGISDNMANLRRENNRLEDIITAKNERILFLETQLRRRDLENALLRNEKNLLAQKAARESKLKDVAISNSKSTFKTAKLGAIQEEQEESSGGHGQNCHVKKLPEFDTTARKEKLLNRWNDLHEKMTSLLQMSRENNFAKPSISKSFSTPAQSEESSRPEVTKQLSLSPNHSMEVETETEAEAEVTPNNANVNGESDEITDKENNTLPFCTTCEVFGHTAGDCDDEECY